MGLYACTNDAETSLQEDNITLTELTQLIDMSALNYIKSNENTKSSFNKDKPKFDKAKAIKLGIADGIGGAMASGLGAYGILWGGFLATLSIEPYIRTKTIQPNSYSTFNDRQLIFLPEDRNELFKYGHFGRNHNLLMKEALDNDVKSIIVDNEINKELRKLILSKEFYEDNILVSFRQQQANLIKIINNANKIGNSNPDIDVKEFIQSFNLNSTQLEIIETINKNLEEISESNFTDYLLSVQVIIENNEVISLEDKESILIYISILNSSLSLWINN